MSRLRGKLYYVTEVGIGDFEQAIYGLDKYRLVLDNGECYYQWAEPGEKYFRKSCFASKRCEFLYSNSGAVLEKASEYDKDEGDVSTYLGEIDLGPKRKTKFKFEF